MSKCFEGLQQQNNSDILVSDNACGKKKVSVFRPTYDGAT